MAIVLDGSNGITFPSGNTQSNAALITSGGTINGNLTLGGNLTFNAGTNGITFNNTGATVNSSLNDYETGSYTPTTSNMTVNSGTNTITGTYTKIGNRVTVDFNIFNTGGTNTVTANSTRVSLPFVALYGSSTSPIAWGVFGNVTSSAASGGIQMPAAGGNTVYLTSTMTSSWISGTISYQTTF